MKSMGQHSTVNTSINTTNSKTIPKSPSSHTRSQDCPSRVRSTCPKISTVAAQRSQCVSSKYIIKCSSLPNSKMIVTVVALATWQIARALYETKHECRGYHPNTYNETMNMTKIRLQRSTSIPREEAGRSVRARDRFAKSLRPAARGTQRRELFETGRPFPRNIAVR